MEDLLIMKTSFNEKSLEIKSKKGKNNQLFTRDEYFSFYNKVKASKAKTKYKTPEDYQRLSRYDVVNMGDAQRLIVPVKDEKDSLIFYTYLEENFDIIHEAHISIGHGGRTRMIKELKKKFKNITTELITIYLNMCKPCQRKMYIPRKEPVVRPIETTELNSRCQVDLVDMQSQADGQYKFIMVYQDHLTKFVQLRAFKSKRVEEVAYHLLDIFTIFGAPCILDSDNGREFANDVINEVSKMWDELKIVHGKPRHSQSQVERPIQDIEKMLAIWLETNKTTHWSEGLKFIQFMKNKAFHSEINTSPYEEMFGCKPKIGLKTFLPAVDISHVTNEEDLEKLQYPQNTVTDISESSHHTTGEHLVGTHSVKMEPEWQNNPNVTVTDISESSHHTTDKHLVGTHSVKMEPEWQNNSNVTVADISKSSHHTSDMHLVGTHSEIESKWQSDPYMTLNQKESKEILGDDVKREEIIITPPPPKKIKNM